MKHNVAPIFMLIVLTTLIFGCENKGKLPMQKLTHQTGFVISIPAKYQFETTISGYVIYPPGGRELRSPIEVQVNYSQDPQPKGEFKQTRDINGVTVHYNIDQVSGGSGGAEYTIQAWQPYKKGSLWFEQTIQLEPPAEPDYQMFWEIVTGVG